MKLVPWSSATAAAPCNVPIANNFDSINISNNHYRNYKHLEITCTATRISAAGDFLLLALLSPTHSISRSPSMQPLQSPTYMFCSFIFLRRGIPMVLTGTFTTHLYLEETQGWRKWALISVQVPGQGITADGSRKAYEDTNPKDTDHGDERASLIGVTKMAYQKKGVSQVNHLENLDQACAVKKQRLDLDRVPDASVRRVLQHFWVTAHREPKNLQSNVVFFFQKSGSVSDLHKLRYQTSWKSEKRWGTHRFKQTS